MGPSGPADQHARGPADFIRQPPDSDRLMQPVDLTPQPAALVHELALAAETDGDEARALARRLAVSLPPEARLVLLSALAEADALHENDRPTGHETGPAIAYGTGCEPSSSAPGGAPERAVAPPSSGLSILPTYREHGPDRPADHPESGHPESGHPESGHPESGDPAFWQAPRNDPPDALIRLRFADATTLGRAGAAFGAGSGPGFSDAFSDPAALTLQIPGDAGLETLRAVLAVLDAAAITAESLTVHTHELDDVCAAFTTLP